MRLSEAWFTWKLRKSLIINTSTINNINNFSSKNTENIIKTNYVKFKTHFKNYWKKYQDENCSKLNCKSISKLF